ncbi:hypothetical protein PVAND_017586 [Polypedilum vanderplanki]|uniref:C-type lectin domain-containing protein n=1 Tax=Polypedilum vanderplanki TaxID=319348 RepID=A0A9J6BJ39_POLVA|nr:hypothetical protein PVAND_017586 [Polypedilum vanderplanki]
MPLSSINNIPIIIKISGFLSDVKTSFKDINFTRKISIHKNENDVEMLVNEDDPTQLNFLHRLQNQNQNHIFIRNIALSITLLLSISILTLLIIVSKSSSSSQFSQFERLIQPSQLEKFQFIHGQLKDLSICLILFNISENNGACLVHQDKSFDDSQKLCSEHNMTLLEINSNEERVKVTEETTKIFGSGGGTRIWINGKYSSKVEGWLSVPREERFFLTQEHIETNYYNSEPKDGDCLTIESTQREKYHISAVSCNGRHYFYCEF